MSDSKAALGAGSRLTSPAALMGALAAEIALALESLGVELVEVKHIPGTGNKSADASSRLSEGAALPQMLYHVPRLPALDHETRVQSVAVAYVECTCTK